MKEITQIFRPKDLLQHLCAIGCELSASDAIDTISISVPDLI